MKSGYGTPLNYDDITMCKLAIIGFSEGINDLMGNIIDTKRIPIDIGDKIPLFEEKIFELNANKDVLFGNCAGRGEFRDILERHTSIVDRMSEQVTKLKRDM